MMHGEWKRGVDVSGRNDPVLVDFITRGRDERQSECIHVAAVVCLHPCNMFLTDFGDLFFRVFLLLLLLLVIIIIIIVIIRMHVILVLVLSRQRRSIVRVFLPQLSQPNRRLLLHRLFVRQRVLRQVMAVRTNYEILVAVSFEGIWHV